MLVCHHSQAGTMKSFQLVSGVNLYVKGHISKFTDICILIEINKYWLRKLAVLNTGVTEPSFSLKRIQNFSSYSAALSQ